MKLVKAPQLVLGIVITGGVVIFLSGNALAADGSSAVVSQTTPTEVNEGLVKQSDERALTVPTTAGGQTGVLVEAAKTQALPEATAGIAVLAQVTAPLGATDPHAVVAETDGAHMATIGALDTGKSPAKLQQTEGGLGASTVEAAAASSDQVAIAETAAIVPVEVIVSVPASAMPVVKYRSKFLPIQPIITSHPALPAQDLAALLPSAAQPSQAPTPPKTNGALGRLTAVLAATVVPPAFLQHVQFMVSVQVLPAVASSLVVVALLLVGLYTVRLRRSGFATAARSDIAAGSMVISPQNLSLTSYASVTLPPHNSIFMAFKREVMV